MAQLISSLGKSGTALGLSTLQVDIDDTSYLSNYFSIAEFNPVFTGGRNPVSFNGSSLLKAGSEIKIECLDSYGNSLYIEVPKSSTQYSDVAKFVISIHIYGETYNGNGKLILVGTTTKNEIVRWQANITIDKTIQNSAKVRFYNKPALEIRPLIYPVINNTIGSALTYQYDLTGSFTAYALNPKKDTNKKDINLKKTDIDYRVILNISETDAGPQLYPTKSFNSQMNGQSFVLNATNIKVPYSYLNVDVDNTTTTTSSFKIKKVMDSKTLQLNDAFYYPSAQDQVVTNINHGTFTSSYKWVAYNSASDSYQTYVPLSGSAVNIKESYAEVTYRNIKPFSGFIARHKLYKKSLIYPGDFQLISDEPLGALELLVDPITTNKSYSQIGSFYNQLHINKYWFINNGLSTLSLSHSTMPMIDAMKIASPNGTWPDGTSYVIAKTTSPGTINNGIYYPYNITNFNNLTGSSYNSNFISLKANSLYVLSTNAIIEKEKTTVNSKVTFYFSSSISTITREKNYNPLFGLKVGEIEVTDEVRIKTFTDKQMLFFTPIEDYYGTLIIVPYNCNVTLSELSLKVYGDYGFSPDILFSKIPFKVNIANEGFVIKAELFDVNSTLVYSDLQTIQSFDPTGETLFIGNNPGSDPSQLQFISRSLVISQSLYLPNIPSCPTSNIRLLGWKIPVGAPPLNTDGQICYTNVSQLRLSTTGNGTSTAGDYIKLATFDSAGVVESVATSLSIKYDSNSSFGRKIVVNAAGTKSLYP